MNENGRLLSTKILSVIFSALFVLLCGLTTAQAQTLNDRPLLRQMILNRLQKQRQNQQSNNRTGRSARPATEAKTDGPACQWIAGRGSTLGPGDYGRKIQQQSMERQYFIHVPRGYKRSTPTPVVLVFHGGGGNPDQQRFDSRMDEISEKHNFIAVYPAGTNAFFKDKMLTWNTKTCCGFALKNNIDDVGYVRSLLDDLSSLVNVDAKRVYATGLSNGAMMSYRLACELSDRIAAIAPIAFQVPVDAFGSPPPRAVPVIHFHGVLDRHASYNGGVGPDAFVHGISLRPVAELLNTWVKHDGCPDKPKKTQRIGHAVGQFYGPGKDSSEVIFWTLEDGGHTWPGGRVTEGEKRLNLGHINTDIDASELMWDFFTRHPMPTSSPM